MYLCIYVGMYVCIYVRVVERMHNMHALGIIRWMGVCVYVRVGSCVCVCGVCVCARVRVVS